jgi:hypothetical protein
MMSGKKPCIRSMMLSSRMGHGSWCPPFKTKLIGCKWVFENKYKLDGSLNKHKARPMVKGFAHKEGIDYEDTLAPTTKWATIRTLFSLATHNGSED